MTTTAATAPVLTVAQWTEMFSTWTDEMVIQSRQVTALRDGQGNLRSFTDAERTFTEAINAEFSRRVNRR